MPNDLISQYDDMGNEYISNQREFFSGKEDWTRVKMRDVLEKFKGRRVLDIGCGAGDDVRWCEENGIEAYGIDSSEKMCEASRGNISNPERIKSGGYENIPFEDGYFDLVMGRFSIHYLKNFEKAYEEMARVLKQGGEIMIIASHPVFDSQAVIESGNREVISVELYNGKVTVQFPPHSFRDYFSPRFLELFDLVEIAESESVDAINPEKLPETLFYRAVKR